MIIRLCFFQIVSKIFNDNIALNSSPTFSKTFLEVAYLSQNSIWSGTLVIATHLTLNKCKTIPVCIYILSPSLGKLHQTLRNHSHPNYGPDSLHISRFYLKGHFPLTTSPSVQQDKHPFPNIRPVVYNS